MTRRYSSQRGRKVSSGAYGSDESVFAPQGMIHLNLSALHSPAHVQSLQRLIGNQATRGLLGSRLDVPVVQRVREVMPEGLSENYSGWVTQYVTDDIQNIINEEGELVDKSQRVWELLNQKFAVSRDNGIRYWAKLVDAINTYKGEKGENVEQKELNRNQFLNTNQQKRQEYDTKYQNYYETVYDDDDSGSDVSDDSGSDLENEYPHAEEIIGGSELSNDDDDQEAEFDVSVQTLGYGSADNREDRDLPGEDDYHYSNNIKKTQDGKFYMHADDNDGTSDDAQGSPGGRLPNSEIFWQQLHGYLRKTKTNEEAIQAQKEMPFLERGSISNAATMAIIFMCIPHGANLKTVQSFQAGTAEFNALLGTENGRAAAYRAIDHLDQIERTITHVETCIEDAGGMLRFHYGDIG